MWLAAGLCPTRLISAGFELPANWNKLLLQSLKHLGLPW